MILVHTHSSTAYNFCLLVYQYICVCMSVCVYVCAVTEFWILRAALNFGPLKTISVTTYTVASSLVFGRGIRVAYALHVNLWFSSKNVQASKTSKNRKNKINQSKIPVGKPHNGTSGESWNPFSLPLAIATTFPIWDSQILPWNRQS